MQKLRIIADGNYECEMFNSGLEPRDEMHALMTVMGKCKTRMAELYNLICDKPPIKPPIADLEAILLSREAA